MSIPPTALERLLFREDPFESHLRENGTVFDEPPPLLQQVKELQRKLVEARLQVLRLQEVLDQTGLFYALARIVDFLRGYQWVIDGEWGSYSYEDQTAEVMRQEAVNILQNVREIAIEALRISGVLVSETLATREGQLALPFRASGRSEELVKKLGA